MAPKTKRRQQEDYDEDASDISLEAPTSINPYTVLNIRAEASASEIKSAYRRLALANHPDKVSADEKESAHVKFQEIAFAYAVLSDERRRARYDATGRTEESLEDDDDFNWTDFFRAQFKDIVTSEKIEEVSKEYKGSLEERDDVLKAYLAGKGKMETVYEMVMLSEADEDEERYRILIKKAIEDGEVEGYATFENESEKSIKARQARATKRKAMFEETRKKQDAEGADESDEDGEVDGRGSAPPNGKATKSSAKKKQKKGDDTSDLAALIQQRHNGRAQNFFDNLEAKYAPKEKGGKGGKKRSSPADEPPEEAFAKNRQKKAKK